MKKLVIALTVIIGTLSVIPVRAGQVSFGYADKSLSLKGIKKTFAKSPKTSNAKPLKNTNILKMKGIEALGDMLYPDAVSYFKQAIAATNDAQEKTELKQYLYTTLKLGGGGSWAMTFPKQAIAMLNEAIAMKPNDFWLYARKGDAYCNMGQLAPCLANHNIAIKLNPNKADGISRLATTLVHIDPPLSAKAFDLSTKLYMQQGDMRNAKVNIAAKSAYGL
jgi:tetratricopeptide (TPR) repeat protein